MSEEKVQDSVQENLGLEVENKTESADSGLLQEVMAKKATIKELQAKLAEHDTAQEKARQKQLSEDGKKDELIAELNVKNEKLEGEYSRLLKYEDEEKATLVASIASDDKEAETLSKESLSTLRLLKNKIAAKSPEPPTARGSIGYQKPLDINKMSSEERKENWGDIIKQYTNN